MVKNHFKLFSFLISFGLEMFIEKYERLITWNFNCLDDDITRVSIYTGNVCGN